MSSVLKIYNAAEDLAGRQTPYGRAILFKRLGGTFTQPEPAPCAYEELHWQVSLFGTTTKGRTYFDAISEWIAAARAATPRRASDGRPDCPYNGAALPENATPTPAEPA